MEDHAGWTLMACEECGHETKVLTASAEGRLTTSEEIGTAQNVLGLTVVCEACAGDVAEPVELGSVQRMIDSQVI